MSTDEDINVHGCGRLSGKVKGFGSMILELMGKKGSTTIYLERVGYCPSIPYTVLGAVPLMNKFGIKVDPSLKGIHLNKNWIELRRCNGLLTLPGRIVNQGVHSMSCHSTEQIHDRYFPSNAKLYAFYHDVLGHTSVPMMQKQLSALGIDYHPTDAHRSHCEVCTRAKHISSYRRRKTLRLAVEKGRYDVLEKHLPGQYLSMDLMKLSESRDGYKAAIIIVCVKTGYVWIGPLKTTGSSAVAEVLQQYMHEHDHLPSLIVLGPHLLADQDRRWSGSELTRDYHSQVEQSMIHSICKAHRIRISLTPPNYSTMNGVAERAIRQVRMKLRTVHLSSGFPETHWFPVIKFAVQYLINLQVPTGKKENSFSLFHGTEFPKSMLRPIGCRAYLLNKDTPRGVQLKSNLHQNNAAVFLGYKLAHARGKIKIDWVFWQNLQDSKTIKTSRDAKFVIGDKSLLSSPHSGNFIKRSKVHLLNFDHNITISTPKCVGRPPKSGTSTKDQASSTTHDTEAQELPHNLQNNPEEEETTPVQLETTSQAEPPTTPTSSPRLSPYPKRNRNKRTPHNAGHWYDEPPQLGNSSYVSELQQIKSVKPKDLQSWQGNVTLKEGITVPKEYVEPKNFAEAVNCPLFGLYWRAAYAKEYDIMMQKATFKQISRKGASKLKSQNKICKDKPLPVKLIFKIKKMEKVVRFKVRFTACGNFQNNPGTDTYSPTSRSGTANILIALGLKYGLSITTADVESAFLEGELEQPLLLYGIPGLDIGDDILLCLGNLYGLAVAPITFFRLLKNHLERFGLVQSEYDVTLFMDVKRKKFVLAYVDDLLIVGENGFDRKLIKFMSRQSQPLKAKVESIETYVGRTYNLQDKVCHVNMSKHIIELVHKYNVKEKHVETPAPSTSDWLKHDAKEIPEEDLMLPYRELVGSLIYISGIRYDIKFTVNKLASFMHCWTKVQYKVAIRLVQYLWTTASSGIEIQAPHLLDDLSVETDASWADNPNTRKSTLGYLIRWGTTVLDGNSKMDKAISLSTAESEYRAASFGTKQLMSCKNFLVELGVTFNKPCKVYMDNQAAIKTIVNVNENLPEYARHVGIAVHHVRHESEIGNIVVCYKNTKQLSADILTKSLSGEDHSRLCNLISGLKFPQIKKKVV